jgi:hypothetical protein
MKDLFHTILMTIVFSTYQISYHSVIDIIFSGFFILEPQYASPFWVVSYPNLDMHMLKGFRLFLQIKHYGDANILPKGGTNLAKQKLKRRLMDA